MHPTGGHPPDYACPPFSYWWCAQQSPEHPSTDLQNKSPKNSFQSGRTTQLHSFAFATKAKRVQIFRFDSEFVFPGKFFLVSQATILPIDCTHLQWPVSSIQHPVVSQCVCVGERKSWRALHWAASDCHFGSNQFFWLPNAKLAGGRLTQLGRLPAPENPGKKKGGKTRLPQQADRIGVVWKWNWIGKMNSIGWCAPFDGLAHEEEWRIKYTYIYSARGYLSALWFN